MSTLTDVPAETLESIRSKLIQLVESMDYLTATISNDVTIPTWKDVLSRYNILLSQTYSLSNTLSGADPEMVDFTGPFASSQNTLKQLALHPAVTHPTDQDNVLGVLFRTKQIPDVEKEEERYVEMEQKDRDASLSEDEEKALEDLVVRVREHDAAVQSAFEVLNEQREQVEWAGRLEEEEDVEESNDPVNVMEFKTSQEPNVNTLENILRFISSGQAGR